MFNAKFLIFLSIGTLSMLVPLLFCGRIYKIKAYKCVIAALCLTLVGTAGTYIMGKIENPVAVGSRSFYGAVFLIPIVFIAIAPLLRIPYSKLIDMSAPSVAIMLVLMKVLCLIEGCCGGCELFVNAEGRAVCFPSQTVELINAAIIFAVLMYMIYKRRSYGKTYAWFMVIYGISRFALNFFRADQTHFVWILPAGHFWSVVSATAGVIWLVILSKRSKKIPE